MRAAGQNTTPPVSLDVVAHCHTYTFIRENLLVPVVISEWHMVEVLTQTLFQAHMAGWD